MIADYTVPGSLIVLTTTVITATIRQILRDRNGHAPSTQKQLETLIELARMSLETQKKAADEQRATSMRIELLATAINARQER